MTLQEALQQAFGDSWTKIQIEEIVKKTYFQEEVHPLRLMIAEEGRVFIHCGQASVLAGTRPIRDVKRSFYVVYDDSNVNAWHSRRSRIRSGEEAFDPSAPNAYSAPSPVLRLAVSD